MEGAGDRTMAGISIFRFEAVVGLLDLASAEAGAAFAGSMSRLTLDIDATTGAFGESLADSAYWRWNSSRCSLTFAACAPGLSAFPISID